MGAGRPDRRDFIKTSATTAAGLTVMAALPRTIFGANDRLRVGLIGCGGRGNYLLDEVLRSAVELNVEVVALCDVWKVNLERTRARLATRQASAPKLFARYGDLLAMPDLDAVLIATPDFAHTQILIAATKAKKDAFCEKPLATVLDHAKEAVSLVRSTRNIVQVGTQRRSDPRHQAGARLIQSGVLGTVTQVSAAWHDAAPRWQRPYDDVHEQDVDWAQYLMFLPKEKFNPARFRRWHFYKDFTTGTPALLGSHLMDVGIWFMDDPLPKSVVAHGGVYIWKDGREHADTIDCALEYPKGFILNYQTRLGNKAPIPEVQFFGSKGTFDTETWTARGEGGGEGALVSPITVPKPAAAAPPTTVSGAGNGGGSGGGMQGGTNAAGVAVMGQNDPRVGGEGHVKNWLECVRSRATPNAPIEVGYAHSVAGIMCLKAWESGRRQIYDAQKMEITAG
jgi:predicted dehydrogenase